MTDIIKPTIHLNGTDRETLRLLYDNAFRAVVNAMEALRLAAPNGRDYYPQGAGVINRAIDQHRDRLRRLDTVAEELTALIEHVSEHGGAK